jgi:hypothetical protein
MNIKLALLIFFICYAAVSEMDYQDLELAHSQTVVASHE